MKLISIAIVCLFISLTSFAQNIDHKKSDKHIQVLGTNLFVIPPSGFVQDVRFVGFKDTLSDAIMVITKSKKSNINKDNARSYKSQGRQVYQSSKTVGGVEYQFLEIELSETNEYYFVECKYSTVEGKMLSENIKKSYASFIIK